MAGANEFDNDVAAEVFLITKVGKAVGDLLATDDMNPWCGICGAGAEGWYYEVGRTRFRSMEEVQPELEKVEAGNAIGKALFGSDGPPPRRH